MASEVGILDIDLLEPRPPRFAPAEGIGSTALGPLGLKRASEMERRARDGESADDPDDSGTSGTVIEVVGNARLSAAVRWTAETQGDGGAVAWISARADGVYPPDLAANGVDLDSLPIVRAKERAETVEAIDLLLRSGFFPLLVVDWNSDWPLEGALQSRFFRLARRYGVTLLFLGEEGESRGVALVPLRIRASRHRRSPGVYALLLEVLRDKRRAGFSGQEVTVYGPPGLR